VSSESLRIRISEGSDHRVSSRLTLLFFRLGAREGDGVNYRMGTFDRGIAVVLVDVRLIGELGRFESDAGFFGGVPPYVVQEAGTGSYAVEQSLHSGANGEGSLVVDA
jgi:hypothetical protein